MEPNPPPVSSRPATRGGPRRVARPLWAAPLFVAGVAVLAWVCVTRPFQNSPECQSARDLAAARQLLERPDGDALEADNLVRHALEHPENLNGRAGEATFLLGRAEARRAEQAPADQAGRLWADALRDLTEAEKLGVPDDDRQQLTYQLGKVGFFAGDDPRRVAERLARSAADADDRAEAYRLLTLANLRLPEPDLEEALKANEQLRQVAVDDQLAEARLQGGELLLKLQRAPEAEVVLARVIPPAPAALVSKARLLRARGLEDAGKWPEAARLWQNALADKMERAERQGLILYHLGLCYQQLEQPGEAAKVWEQCLAKTGSGDEGPACALALAELSLRDNDIDKAIALFARAVEKTESPEQWANSLVDRAKAVEAFERAGALLRQAGRYEPSLTLADAYERLAGRAKANVFRGDVWTDWALAGEQQLREAVASAQAPTPPVLHDRHRHAGAAYLLAANEVTDAETKANYLWLSTQRFLAGEDRVRAAASFEQLLRLDPHSPHLGEGWYRLGEAHRRAADAAAAEAAYNESIKYPTAFAYRARYQLAASWLDRKEPLVDDAEAALEQNLKLLRFDRDDEAQEKSLFAIGNLFFRRGKWEMAARRLEEALERFPDNAEAVKARYNLALAYQQMADQKNFDAVMKSYKKTETVDHYVQENRRLLQRAAEEFEKLQPLLDKPDGAAQLPPDELAKIPFRAADCRFYAGQYAEALLLFDKIADRCAQRQQRTPEETDDYLVALCGTVRSHGLLIGPKNKHREKLDQRIAEMEMALHDVDEPARLRWQTWIRGVQAQLARPEQQAGRP